MEFFTIRDNSFHKRGAPWISGAWPSEYIVVQCKQCNYHSQEPTGPIELRPAREKGTVWTDALGVGGGTMGLYVSEAVKRDWDEHGINYGRCVPAFVTKPFPYRLVTTTPPNYFNILPQQGAVLDLNASGFRVTGQCPACGRIKIDHLSVPQRYSLVEGTWDGSDVFVSDKFQREYFCTRRVIDLAARFKRTNFHFSPLDKVSDTSFKGLEYLKAPRRSRA